MSSSRTLAVAGAGVTEEVLGTISHLCDGTKEARQLCRQLHNGLETIHNTIQSMKTGNQLVSDDELSKFVQLAAKYLHFLRRYHEKELLYRVVEHSSMTDALRGVYEDAAELFRGFDVKSAVSWSEEWHCGLRVKEGGLYATVGDGALVLRELQDQRLRVEATLTLKFEIEKRGECHDDFALGLMKSMLAAVILASNTMEERLPAWFVPLYEVGFESKPFSYGAFTSMHLGVCGDESDMAIKFYSVDREEIDERAQRHMENELNLLFPLSHPNIMKMIAASHINSSPFIVYQYATHGNLGSFLERSNRNKRQVWRLLHEAALGLQYIHKCNVVHGNLKLRNILVDAKGHAKLSDFGLQTMRSCAVLSRSNYRSPVSSDLRWRAPECLKQKPINASDVYSLAMCIIEAFTGEPPFSFLADDDVRDNIRKGEIPAKPDEMTSEMWELVIAMTAFEPDKRVRLNHVLEELKRFDEMQSSEKFETRNSLERTVAMVDESDHSFECIIDPSGTDKLPTISMCPSKLVDELVEAVQAGKTERQELLLHLLADEFVEDKYRDELYSSNGVPVLVNLVTSGSTRFIQTCALLCLSWAVRLDSQFSKEDFEALRVSVRQATQQELDNLHRMLQDQSNAKAVIYCASIAAVAKSEEIQDSELVRLLVGLLRNGDAATKLWSAIALGRLAERAVNRVMIANEGALAPLLVLLQSGTEMQKMWATYALAHICQDNEVNSVSIVNCGAIPLLMVLVQKGTPRQIEFAALTLGHLAFIDDDCCMMISRVGAVVPLVELLRSGTAKQKERSGFALGSLMTRIVDNCNAIEVEGGIKLLVLMLCYGTGEQKESAAFALGTFVGRGDVNNNAAELEDAITYLILLLNTGTDLHKELGALTLGTFSVRTNVNVLAASLERAIAPLINLLRVGTDGPREQAVFALSHLAGMNETSRIAIAQEGAISLLISLLQTGSEAQRDYAALGLGNLAMNNVANSAEIVREGAVLLFISLLRDGPQLQKVYAAIAMGNLALCSNTNSVAIGNGGAIPLLMTLLRTGIDELKGGAAFALARLAINEANCVLMVHDGAIPYLVELLQLGNDRQKEQAAFALSEFADKNYQNCEAIADEGGISPLAALLTVGTEKQKEYAAMALSFICGEDELDEHRVAISRAGAILPLVSLVGNGSDPQKRWAALALGSLAVKDNANCAVMARQGAIPYLTALLQSTLDRHKENAAFALGRLAAYSDENSVISALVETISPLVNLLQVGTDAQKEEAAFALGHISLKNEGSSEIIAKDGAIPLLVSLLRGGTDKQKAYATMALVNLAAHNRNIHSEVVHEGVVGLLAQIERTGTELQKKWAAYSLGRLAFKNHGH